MRKIFLFCALVVSCIILSCNHPKRVDVTYIANAGFLLESGNKQVLVDALFKYDIDYVSPHDSIINKIIKGKEPFDKSHLLLITHVHQDHFNDSMVVQYLNQNTKNKLIAPFLVVDAVLKHPEYKGQKNQIVELSKEAQYKKDTMMYGIRIQSFFLQHDMRPGTENVGYLMDIEGVKILHAGDNLGQDSLHIESLHLNSKGIDIALLGTYWLNDKERKIAIDKIAPKNIIFMHSMIKYHEYTKKGVNDINKMLDNIELSIFDRSMEEKSFTFD